MQNVVLNRVLYFADLAGANKLDESDKEILSKCVCKQNTTVALTVTSTNPDMSERLEKTIDVGYCPYVNVASTASSARLFRAWLNENEKDEADKIKKKLDELPSTRVFKVVFMKWIVDKTKAARAKASIQQQETTEEESETEEGEPKNNVDSDPSFEGKEAGKGEEEEKQLNPDHVTSLAPETSAATQPNELQDALPNELSQAQPTQIAEVQPPQLTQELAQPALVLPVDETTQPDEQTVTRNEQIARREQEEAGAVQKAKKLRTKIRVIKAKLADLKVNAGQFKDLDPQEKEEKRLGLLQRLNEAQDELKPIIKLFTTQPKPKKKKKK